MPMVVANTMVVKPSEIGKIPLRPGSNVYLRDIGVIEDAGERSSATRSPTAGAPSTSS